MLLIHYYQHQKLVEKNMQMLLTNYYEHTNWHKESN